MIELCDSDYYSPRAIAQGLARANTLKSSNSNSSMRLFEDVAEMLGSEYIRVGLKRRDLVSISVASPMHLANGCVFRFQDCLILCR